MIEVREIQQIATDLGLQVQVVEKDYALGWLLAGISQHPALKDSWVFKGGTCLKKCYFETYRFSEDLDFTLTEPSHLDPAFLRQTFAEIGAWLYEQCGLQMPPNLFDFDVHPDPDKRYVLGKVGYIGPRQNPRGSIPKIKLDLTSNELLVMGPVMREVYHPYSDAPAGSRDSLIGSLPVKFSQSLHPCPSLPGPERKSGLRRVSDWRSIYRFPSSAFAWPHQTGSA
jgi:hypothetical protein